MKKIILLMASMFILASCASGPVSNTTSSDGKQPKDYYKDYNDRVADPLWNWNRGDGR
jgi:uncharacterized lipoprotein YajG